MRPSHGCLLAFLFLFSSCKTPRQNTSNLRTSQSVATNLKAAYKMFAEGDSEAKDFSNGGMTKKIVIERKEKGVKETFYGVHKDKLDGNFNYAAFRAEILKDMGMTGSPVALVSGDREFEEGLGGLEKAKNWLISKLRSTVILSDLKGEKLSTNGFLLEALRDKKILKDQTLGFVSGESINSFVTSFPLYSAATHFLVIYDDKGDTKEEDLLSVVDIFASNDFYCYFVEGEEFSFDLAIKAISGGIITSSYYGFRKQNTVDKPDEYDSAYFSAGSSLFALLETAVKFSTDSHYNKGKILASYLQYTGLNPFRGDGKKKLFEDKIQADSFLTNLAGGRFAPNPARS